MSAYGKDGFSNYLNIAHNQGRILYAHKNSQQNNTTGVQFPNNIMSADYSNNLARFKQIVNIKYMQNQANNSSNKQFSDASPYFVEKMNKLSEDFKRGFGENKKIRVLNPVKVTH